MPEEPPKGGSVKLSNSKKLDNPANRASFAHQFAQMAITNLGRINEDDHKRNEALMEVLNYVVEHINDTSLLSAAIESLQKRAGIS